MKSLFKKNKPQSEISVETDVYESMKKSSWKSITTNVLLTIITLYSISQVFITYRENMNHALVIDENGKVHSPEWLKRSENIQVEVAQNIELWVQRFFNYDYIQLSNSLSKEEEKRRNSKLELAAWMIDDKIFTRLKKTYLDQWSAVIRNSLTQEATIIPGTLKVSKEEPYQFQAELLIKTTAGNASNYYKRQIAGKVRVLPSRDYPKNPHGLLITSYKESKRKILKDYDPTK